MTLLEMDEKNMHNLFLKNTAGLIKEIKNLCVHQSVRTFWLESIQGLKFSLGSWHSNQQYIRDIKTTKTIVIHKYFFNEIFCYDFFSMMLWNEFWGAF